jgi:acyl-CoA synthetase (AMP-forming)/AMP-acid ligase II
MANAAADCELTSFGNLGDAINRDGDPGTLAVIDLGAGPAARFYSYRETDTLAGATARGLLSQGLGDGRRVAILSANRDNRRGGTTARRLGRSRRRGPAQPAEVTR